MKRFLSQRSLELLGATIFSICFVVVIYAFQQPPAQPVVKAFPPEMSSQMEDAAKVMDVADAQLKAAQANYQSAQLSIQNILLRAAADLNLSKSERETCPYARNKNGGWVFNCPPPKEAEKKP